MKTQPIYLLHASVSSNKYPWESGNPSIGADTILSDSVTSGLWPYCVRVSNVPSSTFSNFWFCSRAMQARLDTNCQYMLLRRRNGFISLTLSSGVKVANWIGSMACHYDLLGHITCLRYSIFSETKLRFIRLNVTPALFESHSTMLTCDISLWEMQERLIVSSRYTRPNCNIIEDNITFLIP